MLYSLSYPHKIYILFINVYLRVESFGPSLTSSDSRGKTTTTQIYQLRNAVKKNSFERERERKGRGIILVFVRNSEPVCLPSKMIFICIHLHACDELSKENICFIFR